MTIASPAANHPGVTTLTSESVLAVCPEQKIYLGGQHGYFVGIKLLRLVKMTFTNFIVVVVAFTSFARILGECLTTHSLPALHLFFFFFFEVEFSSRTLFPLFMPGSVHSS